MRMDVNKTGADDEAPGIDGGAAAQGFRGHDCDTAVADADLADAVEPAFGIDHAPAGDDHVIDLTRLRRRAG